MNTMVGLEASLHTSVEEESTSNSMKDEKELSAEAAAAVERGLKSSAMEEALGGSMNDDFDPIALLNLPLYDKYQESFANELSFGTFQDDSLPSCRDTNEDFSPRSSSNYQRYSPYNSIGDSNVMKTPMAASSAMNTSINTNSSPETVDSFANDGATPEPSTEDFQFLGPPVSQLNIPTGRMAKASPMMVSSDHQNMNGYNGYNSNQAPQPTMQAFMANDSLLGQHHQQTHQQQPASYMQQTSQMHRQIEPAPIGMPPQMPTSQQFNDMQTLQLMQMQQQQQQQATMNQGGQTNQYGNSMQQQYIASTSLEPQQPFVQQQQQQQQPMQQQAYALAPAPIVYNQAIPGSVRISPGGRAYVPQSSASMSQLSQMRTVLMQNQQAPPFSQGLDQDAPIMMRAANNSSLSHSLHGDTYHHHIQRQTFQSRSAMNQSLSQSLHDPASMQRRGTSFHAMPSGNLVMPVLSAGAVPAGGGAPQLNEAMSQLCDSMRRSAMSRNFVKQLSNRSLSTGQSAARSGVGRTNSMHSQNSSRSLMDNESSNGRAVPVRRSSSAAKYHLQHPMRGINRHDSQQSLGRSNHSCKSFD
ncbi:hypothetical protein MPSEU_001059800 [Mayamaea pseudoterrestris]|nr:hypothetical protein MPSEU_001059800 [Mayamaea pseudoterrestris]